MTTTDPAEGVIRFAYQLDQPSSPVDEEISRQLNAWRRILKDVGLVSQDPARYDGYGFGNLSTREQEAEHGNTFVITATQTGRLASLEPQHYVRVTGFNLSRFWVDAEGSLPPSSESLTHAALYQADARIRWIFHGHSPDIFQRCGALKLVTIPEHVAYGTTDMARAVTELLEANMSRPILFVTLGHEDGVFACGPTARDTGTLMISTLARSLQ